MKRKSASELKRSWIAPIGVLLVLSFVGLWWLLTNSTTSQGYALKKASVLSSTVYTGRAQTTQVSLVDKKRPSDVEVRLDQGENQLKMTVVDALGQPLSAATHRLTDDGSVLFSEVYPDTDISYSLISNGFKEDIILKNPTSIQDVYIFHITLQNFAPTYTPEGEFTGQFVSAESEEVYQILPLFMQDAAGTSSIDLDLHATQVEQQLNTFEVRVIPSRSWLLSEDRVYPVIIDPSIIKGDAPIANWKVQQNSTTTLYDSSSSQKNMTVSGATVNTTSTSTDSIGATSLLFDGVDDYASRAYDADFDFGTGSFSISMWFRHPSEVSGTDTLLGRYSGAGFKMYMKSTGQVCFGIDADSTWGPNDELCSQASFADSTWHHVAAVKNDTASITLYLNGLPVAQNTSLTATGSLSGSSPILYLGIDSDGTTNPWSGYIDQIAMYDYARSAEQVRTDAQSQPQTSISLGQTKDELSDGLVGHWRLDETSSPASDVSGNGNTGTWISSPTSGKGKYGRGIVLTGTQYITAEDAASLDLTANVGLAAWVNVSGGSGTTRTIISKWETTGSNKSYALEVSSGNVFRFLVNRDGGSDEVSVSSTTTPTTGVWYHVVGAFDGKNLTIYVNGVLQGSTAASGGAYSGTAKLCIGCKNPVGGVSERFQGTIDEVRLYSRPLTPQDASKMYLHAPGPVGHWKFDEGTGTTAVDSSGFGNTSSTFVGTMAWSKGQFGNAVRFDGSSRIPVASNTSIDVLPGFSTSFWIKPATVSTAYVIASKLGINDSGWQIAQNSNNYNFRITHATTSLVCTSTGGLATPGVWQHVVVTWDGSTTCSGVGIYVKGIKAVLTTNSTASGARKSDVGNSLLFGSNLFSDNYVGELDDFQFYNYPLSSQQIANIGNARTSSSEVSGGAVGSAAIYFPLDENTGSTATNFGSAAALLNGAITGASWSSAGKRAGALSYDGTGDYIQVTDTMSIDFTSTFTLSGWFNPSTSVVSKALIVKDTAYRLVTNASGQPICQIYASAAWQTAAISSQALSTSSWQHVACTYDQASGSIKIFIDGVEKGVEPETAAINNSTANLRVGSDTSASYGDYSGLIDEVRIYNYALSQSELSVDYNQGKGAVLGAVGTDASGNWSFAAESAYCVPGDTSSCGPPIAEWKFDEKAGTTAFDTSGNGISGTLTNSPRWVPGRQGSGLEFATASDYVSLGTTTAVQPSQLTFTTWVKRTEDWSNQIMVLFWGKETWNQNGFYLQVDDNSAGPGTGRALVLGVNGENWVITQGDVNTLYPLNEWVHVAASFDSANGNAAFYVNGIRRTTTVINSPSTISTSGGDKRIGSDGAYSVKGQMDNVRIYDYIRTPAQIAWEYNKGAPVAHYKMDECSGTTMNNWGSSGNPGSFINLPGSLILGATGQTAAGDCSTNANTAWYNGREGAFHSSVNLDGTDDYVSLGTSDSLACNTNTGFSVSAWFKLKTDPTAANPVIVSRRQGSGAQNWSLHNDYGAVSFSVANTVTSSQSVWANTNIVQDRWHHAVGIWDPVTDKISLYFDGRISSQATLTSCFLGTGYTTLIGAAPQTPVARFFNGQIDDVRYYNYPLTAAQVRDIMNMGAVRFQ